MWAWAVLGSFVFNHTPCFVNISWDWLKSPMCVCVIMWLCSLSWAPPIGLEVNMLTALSFCLCLQILQRNTWGHSGIWCHECWILCECETMATWNQPELWWCVSNIRWVQSTCFNDLYPVQCCCIRDPCVRPYEIRPDIKTKYSKIWLT